MTDTLQKVIDNVQKSNEVFDGIPVEVRPYCDLLDIWWKVISAAHSDWKIGWTLTVHGTDKRMT
jgi:hypothetical protein